MTETEEKELVAKAVDAALTVLSVVDDRKELALALAYTSNKLAECADSVALMVMMAEAEEEDK